MTIKTQIGWIIAYEENNKISCIKFSKRKAKGHSSTILLKNLADSSAAVKAPKVCDIG